MAEMGTAPRTLYLSPLHPKRPIYGFFNAIPGVSVKGRPPTGTGKLFIGVKEGCITANTVVETGFAVGVVGIAEGRLGACFPGYMILFWGKLGTPLGFTLLNYPFTRGIRGAGHEESGAGIDQPTTEEHPLRSQSRSMRSQPHSAPPTSQSNNSTSGARHPNCTRGAPMELRGLTPAYHSTPHPIRYLR